SLGLKADGSIVAWGSNRFGQRNVPAPNMGFVAVAAGLEHSLGLKADGSIVVWGNPYEPPVPNTGFVAVAGGGFFSLGLKSDGSIVAWGSNLLGQSDVPAPNMNFVEVAASSGYDGLGLKADGTVAVWGFVNRVPEPNEEFAHVAAGEYHFLGLKADGSIVAWGNNSYGQTNVPTPNTGFVAVSAGNEHSLGLKPDGSIVAWGRNYESQTNVPAPNTGFAAVGAGGYYSLGLKADGSIVAWGYNSYGQTNVPAPNSDFVALSAGWKHSVGLKADGSIIAWGDNSYGQTNVPAPNTGFVAVAAGSYHSLGLKADGSIVAWGCGYLYNFGQCDVPLPNIGFVAVTAGGLHSLAIRRVVDCNGNEQPDFCDIQYGGLPDVDEDGIPDECEPQATLDIRPGACPNPVSPRSHGVLPAAIVGSSTLDVTQIDTASLELRRADGVGGSVAPLFGPPGPGIQVADVATPFAGSTCDCHGLGPDGTDDLVVKFSTAEMVRSLELESFSPGTPVELTVTGSMNDGTPFEASDCIVIAGGSVKPSGRGSVGESQVRRP
ncbi:MAG: hypothetical protein Q7R41_00475, partial [Phycisphaerales bacterium]|nr:hypothetical protein [Phycisphaerales bacterium]